VTLPLRLGDLSTDALATAVRESSSAVVLVPVGSVEPHGPHLPLATDTWISEAASLEAAAVLRARGTLAFVAPNLPYGVTDFADGFAGAISIPAPVLTAFLRAMTESLLRSGFRHVCLVNNHLEPAHDEAVRAAVADLDERASVACPLTRRWARTLTPEFKSGACHAGQYETSLVLAIAPELVDETSRASLPASDISLSIGIKQGVASFRALGMDRAYTGAPGEASAAEGRATLSLLTEMIVTEVTEALAGSGAPPS
jgi:creatinine amidohydrolase